MRTAKTETKLCLVCMEEHEVDTVEVVDYETFKKEEVAFNAVYEYCCNADEYLETEEMIKANSLAMKDAYREKVNLLTSKEIVAIREKYGVSQKDFSEVLCWGGATITRYENHQVQDRAHDDVLRKIDADPKWFLEMLERSKERIPQKALDKYRHEANEQFNQRRNAYLIDVIRSIYADYENEVATGRAQLNLVKVVEMINYLALKMSSLHKVKLMKLLWYADSLHFKRHKTAISGLVYSALQMGAVPRGYEHLVMLQGVSFEEMDYGHGEPAYKFECTPGFEFEELSQTEIETLDEVISKLGHLTRIEIVNKMHEEEGYKCTERNCIIPFSYAERLSID